MEIAEDRPAFIYRWEVCTHVFLGRCTKTEKGVDYYDLTDPKVRSKLRDMGFLAGVESRNL